MTIASPTQQSTTVTLTSGAATVTAHFAVTTHTLTVSTVGSGSVVKNPDQSIEDLVTEITAKIGEKIGIARFACFRLGETA